MEITENKFKESLEQPQVESPVATYDPTKKYKWDHNSTFVLKGEEFALVLNSLRMILQTPEAQKILMTERAADQMEHLLARAVESGVAKEDPSGFKK